MNAPRPTEHVIAYKRDAGRVTVHAWRRERWDRSDGNELTDCNRRPEWQWRSWLWLEFRTLNPERVVLCKRCFVEV